MTPSDSDEDRKDEETVATGDPEESEADEEEEEEEKQEDEKQDSREECSERCVTFYQAYDQTVARLEALLSHIREQPQLAKNPEAAGLPGAPFPRQKLALVDMVTKALVPVTAMNEVFLAMGSGPRRKRPRVRGAPKVRAEDSAGFKLMAKLGEISASLPEILTAGDLQPGMQVLVHQGPTAPCAWGMIPHPLPPPRQPTSYTPPITTDENGVEQFRMQRTQQCIRLFSEMRQTTDFAPDRWVGGLYHPIEIPSFYVTEWTESHEAVTPFDSE